MPRLPGCHRALLRCARLLPLAMLVAVAACGDDDDDNGPPPTTADYAGPFASSASAGVLEFSYVTDESPASATGSLDFTDGRAFAVTGTFDGTTLALSGSGYAFAGALVDDAVISGTFTGPSGESGTFSATLVPEGTEVTVLCGEYTGDEAGVFSMALLPDRSGGAIVGNQTARVRAGTGTDEIEVLLDAAPTTVIATGTLSDQSVTGAWDSGDGESGTFAGSVAACATSPAVNATTYFGVVTGDGPFNGGLRLDFSVPPSGTSATITGTVTPTTQTGGSPVALTGSVTAAGAITLTGTGWTLSGQLSDDEIRGTWTATGADDGIWTAAAHTNLRPATAYCGRYAPTPTSPTTGSYDVLIFGARATNVVRGDPDDSPISFLIPAVAQGGAIGFISDTPEQFISISGNYDGTTASGSFSVTSETFPSTLSGTFNTTRCPGT